MLERTLRRPKLYVGSNADGHTCGLLILLQWHQAAAVQLAAIS